MSCRGGIGPDYGAERKGAGGKSDSIFAPGNSAVVSEHERRERAEMADFC